MNRKIPLVVDLDGTLIENDTLIESTRRLLKRSPVKIFLLPFWLIKGKAAFKDEIASHINLDPKDLPYDQEVINLLKKEKGSRDLILMTAANERIAKDVADHLELFDSFYGSTKNLNLKGSQKVKLIKAKYSHYAYAGNSHADIPVWQEASEIILVYRSHKLRDHVRERFQNITHEFDRTK